MVASLKVVPAEEVRRAIEDSELIGGLSRARGRLPETRALSEDEISLLERAGNTCPDWSKVSVAEGFDPRFVRASTFFGHVKIGATGLRRAQSSRVSGATIPSGIYDSVLVDSVVCDGACVCRVGSLSNMIVEPGAIVSGCSEVSCSGGAKFGNGMELPIAIETGGREVATYAELTIPVAERIAGGRSDAEMLSAYGAAVAEYVKAATSDVGVICEGAKVSNTPVVRDAFVGPHAHVDGATWVENVTVLSNEEEQTEIISGAYVKDAIIQWGCEVATMGIVSGSVMTEHSHVERHGKLTDSIVGPNTGVAEGEVTACLLGPFVGFHHQALLIAAYWPEGKGNVGYGANIGSNHTSKAPDQEIWPGEGAFFGLGVNIKYPADFSEAPYSVIASGVTTLPQKMTFPFSLINSPAKTIEGISPAYNELSPGWVLSDNIFTVRRNEGKYRKRNKARRSEFVFDVFRPDTVDKMIHARDRLRSASGKEIYLREDLDGLGKNYMREAPRVKGIESYTFYVRYYALLGLKRVLAAGANPKSVLSKETDDEGWEHQRRIIAAEFPGEEPICLLEQLVETQRQIARSVEASKRKDDTRGVKIIPDYAEAHAPASEDSFVKQTHEETEHLAEEVEAIKAARW